MGLGTAASRVWVLALVLCGAGALAASEAIAVAPPTDQPFQAHWLLLALGFAAAEAFPAHLDVRNQAQTLTFAEVPLTFGLLLADPSDLIVARLAVALGVLVLIRRAPPVKLLFNLGMFALQVGVAVLAYHELLGEHSAVGARGWIAGISAAVLSYLVSAAAVTSVMAVVGSFPGIRGQALVVAVGLCTSVAGSFAALAAAGSLWRDTGAWLPLVAMIVVIAFFGIQYLRVKERHLALDRLNDFTSSLVRAGEVDELARTITCGSSELLRSRRAVLIVRQGRDADVYESRDGAPATASRVEISDRSWTRATTLADAYQIGWPEQHVAGIPLESTDVIVRPIGGDMDVLLAVDARRTEARRFDDEDVRVLETAAGHAATALHNAGLVSELRREADIRAYQALHDEVTGLPNSRGLGEAVTPALASGTALALVTVRVGSLREVNETLGRATGDVLLREVTERLRPIGNPHWCSKTGNDEYTLVEVGDATTAESMSAAVVDAFDDPVHCGEVALAVSAGVGIALAPSHGREIEILLRRASLAASLAQVEGKKVSVWAADRDPYDPRRLAIAADLRDAIPAGELDVHFQPQVDSRTGLVTGAEALVRWEHPVHGQLRPDQFIAAAEYTGAIDALTAHVLGVASTHCAEWRLQGWDLEIGVNVSARNLTDPTFADTVRGILLDTRLDPGALTLELTESTVMSEAEVSKRTMENLARIGVKLSIDDFGTGFSSLAHLRKLPVAEIKIDKSFVFDLVTNPSDQAIVRAMIDLGRNLGLRVVVEGVETVEVRQRLLEMGADRIQGYLLARPAPPESFVQWISDRPVRMIGGPTAPGDLAPRSVDVDPLAAHIRERLDRMAREQDD